MGRLRYVFLIGLLAAACHIENLYRVVGLTFAIRRQFGGDAAVEATLTEDARLFVVFQDDRRSSVDTVAQLAFADSIVNFVVKWFDKERLSAISLRLTHTSRLPETRQVNTSLHLIFVPEYGSDGSVRLIRIDAASETGPSGASNRRVR